MLIRQVKERIRDLIMDYIELNEIEEDPEKVADNIEISVKVKLLWEGYQIE